MKTKLLLLLLISIVNSSFGQEVVDTVFLNKKWNASTKEDAKFYRLIYKKDSLFYIKDYYLNGNIQMSGTCSSLDPQIREGEFLWYFKNGKLSEKKVYKNNLKSGEAIDYRNNGNLLSTSTYLNGKVNGVKCWWKRNGTLDFTSIYSEGEYDFSEPSTLYSDLHAISIMDTNQEMYTKEYIADNISSGYYDYYFSASIKEYFYRDSEMYCEYKFRFYRNRKLKYKSISDYTNTYRSYYYRNGSIKSLRIISNDKKSEIFKNYDKSGKVKSELIIEDN